MMELQELLREFHAVAADPKGQMKKYLAEGKQVVLCAPVYTPEEIIHAMGLIPFGAWGGDMELSRSKEYCPAFLCSIVQSILELGMRGAYAGASAIVIPSLCDTLKTLGQNWKYAVKDIPFIPMTYPQNRKPQYGRDFTKAGYERVIRELEAATGAGFSETKLAESIGVYNAHNAAMRRLEALLATHGEITCAQRSDIFKSAFFMEKSAHTALVSALCDALESAQAKSGGIDVAVTGILTDMPALNQIFDELGYHIVYDDVAAQSRQYRVDCPEEGNPLAALADKFAAMDGCSVLFDREKTRLTQIVAQAQARRAKGVVVVMTKFCDPEEFDYPLLRKACQEAGLACLMVEVDRQMEGLEQGRTLLEAFGESISA